MTGKGEILRCAQDDGRKFRNNNRRPMPGAHFLSKILFSSAEDAKGLVNRRANSVKLPICLSKSVLLGLLLNAAIVGCATTEDGSPENTDGVGVEGEPAADAEDTETAAANEALLGVPADEASAGDEGVASEEAAASEETATTEEEGAASDEVADSEYAAEGEEVATEEGAEDVDQAETGMDETSDTSADAAPLVMEEQVEETPSYQLNAAPAQVADTAGNESIAVDAEEAVQTEPAKESAPAQAAVSTPAPSASSEGQTGSAEYIVLPGDTLSAIAKKVTGSHRNWKRLADHNGIADPTKIHPGDVIKLQAEDTATASQYLAGVSTKTVTVEKGDTLEKIAAKVMGSASYWPVIWRLNVAVVPNPHRIYQPQSLVYYDVAGSGQTAGAVAH
jgi:nucleoid-associated protein YgaU